MTRFICTVNDIVWGAPALILMLSVGVFLSIRTRWVQFRLFPSAFRNLIASCSIKKHTSDGISGFQALCTALGATVGTGNIVGVAGAISIGGPGAIFWMWICGILGMATKFAEATLAVHFRIKKDNGSFIGGPMYIIRSGMGRKWSILSVLYCFFGISAAFGVGSATQVNALLEGVHSAVTAYGGRETSYLNLLVGVLLAIFVVYTTLGDLSRISEVTSFIVPFASVFYIVLCFGAILSRASAIPYAFDRIISGAFCPKAVTGGMIGSVIQVVRVGSSRGVFTNEAGMGTAGIAHASARVKHPVEQGMMGIMEVFLDTIVICTLTSLVILCSGIEIEYGRDLGIHIATESFEFIYGGWVNIPLAFALCSFAVASMLGWGLYGVRCTQFLFGEKALKCFGVLQGGSIIAGALMNTGTVWAMSELANGLMAIPNLIVLAYFCSEVSRLVNEYQTIFFRNKPTGGTYENFNQRKSLRTISYEKISSIGGKSGKRRKSNISS